MKWIVAALIIWGVWMVLRKPKRAAVPAAVADDGEARSILGVAAGADAATIRAAHRRLIATTHPDRGGSTEQTRKLNAARDLLLSRASRTAR